MHPPNRCVRINLSEMKAQLFKSLGPARSVQYFDCLQRLLSLRLSKVEFDKLCLKLLGKENLSLHNQLIRAVQLNASIRKISTLGLNGEANFVSLSHKRASENGRWRSHDSQKLLHHHQQPIGDAFTSGQNRCKSQALVVERCNNVDKFRRRQHHTPIRTLFHQVSERGHSSRSYDNGELPDTISLKEQMQQIAINQGLKGVTLDCANMLSLGLNSYLKTLIASCIQLVRTGSMNKVPCTSHQRDQVQQKVGNGVFLQEEKPRFPITMLDVRAATELIPQELGEDWPSMLERISVHAMKG
ncbi:hypothetical protein SAY87_000613 [Trapa incisa]|uniref:Transcriptional coactivator Hfi1/Transcriptional adapter 1 n=2 Tax=Trapa TaxID=22665 RepID=A0AAN7MLA1_TRANT|nr:hypothetical protein SAY87_000613 [Trapa incisa]KAK4801502.1 hypothetical protein SAY86_021989 [Trapa natans]